MTRNSPEKEILIQAQSSDCDSRPTSEDVDEALRGARIRIQQNRRQLVSTLADLARNVTEMLAIPGAIASQVVETSSDPSPTTESDEITSKTEITAILVELGLSPRELKLLEGFSKKLVGSQQLLIKNAVSLDTISALLNSDAASRAEALTRISAGARIGVRDVKEIRSETLDARASPHMMLSRAYRSHLASRARCLAKDTVADFQASVLQFVSSFQRYNRFISHLPTQLDDFLEMADVLEFDPSKTDEMRDGLAQEAARVLDQFNSLFPNAEVPVRDWSFLASDSTELFLAKSYFLLSRASTGDFADLTSEFSQFIELDGLNTLRLLGGARNLSPRAFAAYNQAARPSAKETPLRPAASLDKISSANPIRRFTAVEIFSASGASALGLEAASFHVAALCEENPEGRKSIESNRPDWGTADRLDWQTIKAAIPDSLKSKRVDVVCGAIPGRPWERKQGGAADPRNRLADVLNVISEAKPDGVFFEISASFLDTRHVLHHDRLIQKLSALGYNAKIYPVSGEDYGLGQTRVRAVIMGVKRSLNRPLIPPFITEPLVVSADATLKNYLNRKDAYAVDRLTYDRWDKLYPSGQTKPKLSPDLVSLLNLNSPVLRQWREFGLECDYIFTPQKRRRRDERAERTVNFNVPTAKALQGLPVDWVLSGDEKEQCEQVCRTIPPRMMRMMAQAMHATLTGQLVDLRASLEEEIQTSYTTDLWQPPIKASQTGFQKALPYGPRPLHLHDDPESERLRRFRIEQEEAYGPADCEPPQNAKLALSDPDAELARQRFLSRPMARRIASATASRRRSP